MDARLVANVESAGERRERLVRAHDPRFRLQHGERAFRNADRVPALGLLAVESVPLDPAGLERRRRALVERADNLEQAVQLEQRLARLGLELAPESERFLREADVFLLRVGEAEDPRAPVAGTARVSKLELLVDDDVVPASAKRTCGREPHHTCADDRDLLHRPIVYRKPAAGTASNRLLRSSTRPSRTRSECGTAIHAVACSCRQVTDCY